MVHASAAGFSTPYLRAGAGTPVLLIHSLGGSMFTWAQVQRRLSEHADVVAYDWGGHGLSEKVVRDFTMHDLGRQAVELAAQIFEQPAVLVGVAAGAAIALHAALAGDPAVAALVLGSPTIAVPAAGAEGMRNRAAQLLKEGMAAAVDASVRGAFSADFAAGHPDVIDRYRHDFLGVAPDAYARSSRAFGAHDLTDRIAGIDVPALLLACEEDRYFPPEHTLRMKVARPDWVVEELAGVGHYSHLEAPDRVVEAVLGVLGQVAAV